MARFYFDFHDAGGVLRDDAGEELPSATIARKEALKTVGQAVMDLTYRHGDVPGSVEFLKRSALPTLSR